MSEIDSVECHSHGTPDANAGRTVACDEHPTLEGLEKGSRGNRHRPPEFPEFHGMDSRYPALRRAKDSNPTIHPGKYSRKSNTSTSRRGRAIRRSRDIRDASRVPHGGCGLRNVLKSISRSRRGSWRGLSRVRSRAGAAALRGQFVRLRDLHGRHRTSRLFA